MEYKWNFNPLECYPEKDGNNDVVCIVHWQYSATENINGTEYTETIIGTQSLPIPQGSFIPYDQLTKETVQGWVESEIGAERLADMRSVLNKGIDQKINPVIKTISPPWL